MSAAAAVPRPWVFDFSTPDVRLPPRKAPLAPPPDRVIGFSGARLISPAMRKFIVDSVSHMVDPDIGFVTGAANGSDALIGRTLARLYPQIPHMVLVPADRSQVDPWWTTQQIPISTVVKYMPDGSTFADRNRAIVENSQQLWAYPLWPEHHPRSRRSGTWQTVRIARVSHREVITHVLSGL